MPVPAAKVQNSLEEHGFIAWAVFRLLGHGPGSATHLEGKTHHCSVLQFSPLYRDSIGAYCRGSLSVHAEHLEQCLVNRGCNVIITSITTNNNTDY